MTDRLVTIVVSLLLIWIVVKHKKDTKIFKAELSAQSLKCDSLQRRVDSLWGENFIHQTNAMRYQIAAEILENENPKAAIEFNKALSQTE